MHGRLKKDVATLSPEEQEKQREQVRTGRSLFAKLLELRGSRTYSLQTLDMTSKALQFHPEFPTLWGFRREILLSGQAGSELVLLLESELKLLEKALRKSQKVYSIWFHRRWVVEQLFKARHGNTAEARTVLNTELELCSKLLEVDERNFHCWNHRAHVVSLMRQELAVGEALQSGTSLADLSSMDHKLSTQLINRNFSNYSAWHLRALLQQGHGDAALLELDVAKELEWVQQGIYTEPNDQSVWLYHNWLTVLDKGRQRPYITHCCILDSELYVFFSRPVCVSLDVPSSVVMRLASGIDVPLAGQLTAVVSSGTRPLASSRRLWSLAWVFEPSSGGFPAVDGEIEVQIEASVELMFTSPEASQTMSLHRVAYCGYAVLGSDASNSKLGWAAALTAALGRSPGAERQELLNSELARVEELLDLEPSCRWALLATSRLRTAAAQGLGVDAMQETELKSEEALKQTQPQLLDPLRKGFYADSRAAVSLKVRILRWLSEARPSSSLDCSVLELRHLAPAMLLPVFGIRSMNLEGNALQEFGPLLLLRSLEELRLSRNRLRGCVSPAFALPRLRLLNVSDNKLELRVHTARRYPDELNLSGNEAVLALGKEEISERLVRRFVVDCDQTGRCICTRC